MRFGLKTKSLLLAGHLLVSSCASTTIIRSVPAGAKLYVDGEPVGLTPYRHTDTKLVGSPTTVKLEKEGYAPLNTTFYRNEEANVGAIVGGLLLLVPFLWFMKYKDFHVYELLPKAAPPLEPAPVEAAPGAAPLKKAVGSKADRLREIKSLLDDNIISLQEFNDEKKKILAEGEE